MQETTKYCPQCGAEYLVKAQQCADCGCALVWTPLTGDGRRPPLEAPSRPGPETATELVRTAEEAWIRELAAVLDRRKIPFLIVPAVEDDGEGGVRPVVRYQEFYYNLYVRPEDREAAEEVDAHIAPEVFPALEETPYLEVEGSRCPACGYELPESCAECPDCGLVFAVGEEGEEIPGEDANP